MISWPNLVGRTPTVLDGGLSTQLTREGYAVQGPLWTGRALLDDPQALARAHAAFARSGAQVIISGSYQVSRQGFAECGWSADEADTALLSSVEVARASRVIVAASVGPYGAVLHDGSEYRGNYGIARSALTDFHRRRIDVLVDASPDLLAVETIPDVAEAEVIAEVLSEYADLPAWFSFTARDSQRLWAGQTIEEAVMAVDHLPNLVAVGINCTDPTHVSELIERIAAVTALPAIVYPNAGGEWNPVRGEWQHLGPTVFTDALIREWIRAGAVAVGGCCGTDARTVRAIAQVLRR